MKRHLCLWIPNWPIQRLTSTRPELRDRPLILIREQRGKDVVAVCCDRARGAGVRPGIPVAEARMLLTDSSQPTAGPRILPTNAQTDQTALRKLAWDCDVFSPLVGIEVGECPASLLIDISGAAACFRGEPNLVRQVLETMQAKGLHVRIGIADTIGTAWAVSHYRTRSRASLIVPPGAQEQPLRPLPIEALRLPAVTVEKLHSLGIRQIAQLLALPRKSLPSRFGEELLLRIDQALGHCPEPIVPERRPEPIREIWESESPLHDREAVGSVVGTLVNRLVATLNGQGAGILSLHCKLWPLSHSAAEFHVRFVRPTADSRHAMDLVRLQWERITVPAGITRIQTEVTERAVLTTHERHLFKWDNGNHERDIGTLLEKLTSRLGREAVLRPVIEAEHQPEQAYRYEPWIENSRATSDQPETATLSSCFRLSRPLWLKRQPISVEVLSVVPDGPPYRLTWQGQIYCITQSWGPERITTGWWRGEHVKRDYYQVETAEGQRLWLFRDWTRERWYLHATFD